MSLKNRNGYAHKGYSKTVKLKSGASKIVTVKSLAAASARTKSGSHVKPHKPR